RDVLLEDARRTAKRACVEMRSVARRVARETLPMTGEYRWLGDFQDCDDVGSRTRGTEVRRRQDTWMVNEDRLAVIIVDRRARRACVRRPVRVLDRGMVVIVTRDMD